MVRCREFGICSGQSGRRLWLCSFGRSAFFLGINLLKRILGSVVLLMIVLAGVLVNSNGKEEGESWLPSWMRAENANPKAKGGPKSKLIPVRVAVAVAGSVGTYMEGVGTVKARSSVAVKSQIEGQMTEALVKEGETVHKGDVLFKLDPRPLKAKLKEEQANLARAQASYDKAVGDVKRLSNLSSKGYSPQTVAEDAQTQVEILAATLRATAAAVELAQLNLDYATIQSPIDGRIGRILITPGNIVKPSDTQPLLIITETKPVYVSFSVPEQNIDEIRTRMAETDLPVEVSTLASQAMVATGRLFFINNQVDTATGTIELLAQFDNFDERLVPGQFIRAKVHLSTLEDAVLIPRRAVQINQSGRYLWVVLADNTVELRSIVTGPDKDDHISILKGLISGERVVTDGQLKLFLGAKVQISDPTGLENKQAPQ